MPLADTQAIAIFTRRRPATVRWWAHRGWLQRKGTGPRGRALYATEDAEALILRLLVDNAPDLRQHLDDSRGFMPLPAASDQEQRRAPLAALHGHPSPLVPDRPHRRRRAVRPRHGLHRRLHRRTQIGRLVMGNWVAHVEGRGAHDNADNPGDADELLKEFVLALRRAGHQVHAVSFTSGGTKELPVAQTGSVELPADYVQRP